MEQNTSTKENIIKTAKNLMRTNGSFTIKELADTCFINIAAVNYHFGSKDNLLTIVLQEIIDELKDLLSKTIAELPNTKSNEVTMEKVLDVIYTYAIENIGIISYLFLQPENQGQNSHILVKEFFSDSEFTDSIYKKIAEVTNTTDEESLRIKYLVLFSSFTIPLFIQILDMKNNDDISLFKTPSFKNNYIKELVKILYD